MSGYWLLTQAHTTVRCCRMRLAAHAYAVMLRHIARELRGL